MKTGISVQEAMTRGLIVTKPTTSLKECAELMRKRKIGSLPIVYKNKILGIVTDEDLVRKALAEKLNPETTQVRKIMTKKVVTIAPEEDIYDALLKMNKYGLNHLPVTSKNQIIGLLTWRDILKLEPELFDLYIEKLQIKKYPKWRGNRGQCDICDEFTILEEVNGQLLCDKCQEELE